MVQSTITSAPPGNMVVPLSAIIDRLQGKMTAADLNALLLAVVGQRKSEVRPGDLITADLINQVLGDIQGLNAQVAALAGGTGATTKNSQAIITFHDARSAYSALVKKGSFLPETNSADALHSAISITAYLQDVASAALSAGVLSYVTGTDNLLEAFRRLYDRQRDLVVLFAAAIPGIPDTSDHRLFSTLLNIQLEQNDSLGGLSLKNALDSKNLDAAIAAQARINGLVMNQGGDVTTGNLEVTFGGSQGTETLVINSPTAAVILFNVTNKTNRTLTAIQLKAEFIEDSRKSWTQFATVVDPVTGNALASISLSPFDSNKPTDPSAKRQVGVAVRTPTGAADGDSGTLQLTASVPAPVGVIDSAERKLFVGSTASPPKPATITFTQDSPIASGDLANSTEGTPLTLDFTFNFNVLQGPQTRDFRSRVEISSSAADAGLFKIQFGPAALAIDAAASNATKKVSLPFQMTHGSKRTWRVVITPQAGASHKQLVLKAVVESIADGIKEEIGVPTISVK